MDSVLVDFVWWVVLFFLLFVDLFVFIVLVFLVDGGDLFFVF